MKTLPHADREVLELVRGADPMLDPRVQADAGLDTEAALRVLAPKLLRSRGRRRRRAVLRLALLAGAAGAAAFVLANVVSSGSDSAVQTAQAKLMILRARAALFDPPGAIIEEDSVMNSPAFGATSTTEVHQWVSTTAPYDTRQIFIDRGGCSAPCRSGTVRWEEWYVSGRHYDYDPATNTVYVVPANEFPPEDPRLNTARAEIRSLLNGYVCPNRNPRCPPRGALTVNPNAKVNGTPAIEFTFQDGEYSYWVSASDYRPLQFEARNGRLPDGHSAIVLGHFPIERLLTGAAASPSLVSLHAQHPRATIDENATDDYAFQRQIASRLG